MERFLITGGNELSGSIRVNGAKNHVLKVIPATLLMSGASRLTNIPLVEDVHRMLEIIEQIGASINLQESADGMSHEVEITAPTDFDGMLPEDLVPQLRSSLVLLGPLLTRFGQVQLPHPGGCNLGKRPIDFFIAGFEAFGASVSDANGVYTFSAPDGLTGAEYVFPAISVTGTETMMMAATLATGTTVLHNAAAEPEIPALADWLNACGAKITGAGTHTITIEGVDALQAQPVEILPDRIEAGSFTILAAATNSNVTITHCRPDHIRIALELLKEAGVEYSTTEDSITVYKREAGQSLKPVSVVTHEYPGFPTDLQAPMTVLLTQANGQSKVRETIYDGRLFYTDLLNTMGATISMLDPYRVIVDGPTALRGKVVTSPDLRAGIAMVIAGLMATGQTEIQNIYQIDRGYERLEERLKAIGADIERTEEHAA